jgi:hypothetical protein
VGAWENKIALKTSTPSFRAMSNENPESRKRYLRTEPQSHRATEENIILGEGTVSVKAAFN